jgi:hypothetical protein
LSAALPSGHRDGDDGFVRLLPALVLEPPSEYVAFVAAHLQPLRDDAVDVVGDEQHAGELYPEVLTDVAVHWRMLQLLRHRLGRPAVAERYLRRAFDRRCQQWYAAQVPDEGPLVDIQVWSGDRPPGYRPALTGWASPADDPEPPRWESRATRLAAFVLPASTEAGPEVEAAIAWWHAYESHRRRRLIAAVLISIVLFMLFWRLRGVTSGTG